MIGLAEVDLKDTFLEKEWVLVIQTVNRRVKVGQIAA